MLAQIDLCDECGLCLEGCPVYNETGNELFSPLGRVKSARAIFSGEQISGEMVESMYNCPMCGTCDVSCPKEIKVSEIVADCRRELVRKGSAPLPAHNKIIEGILETGNAVNGDPEKRLEWLPEEFEDRKSDTLLYLGCIPSFLLRETASSSYLVLKKAGIDFMLLKDEGCCGTYFYDSGRLDLAERWFGENNDRFKALGIKRLIVPCVGCYRCFKRYYPQVLGKVDFEVYHITEILHDLLQKGALDLEKRDLRATYHDPCHLGRAEGIYEEPREILRACGAEIVEMEKNRNYSVCCGAGAGIRSVFRDLSLKIASRTLDMADTDTIVSPCSFCTFNLRWASRKADKGKEIKYITEIILDCLR